jgi:hypothetical protein
MTRSRQAEVLTISPYFCFLIHNLLILLFLDRGYLEDAYLLPKLMKTLCPQCIRKRVHQLLVGTNVLQLNVVMLNTLPGIVKLDVDVLAVIMIAGRDS